MHDASISPHDPVPADGASIMSATLAFDAFASVKLSPSSPLLWQRLCEFVSKLGFDERTALCGLIANLPLVSRDAQWLRCSAMAYLTRDASWFAGQAALVDDTTAPDAIMTLLALAWHHGVVRSASHQDFAQLLRALDAPRLQGVVAARIRKPGQVRRNAPDARPRVAVYTPEIGDREHGGTAMLLNLLSMLAGQDIELHAFSAKEMSIPGIGSYHGGAEVVNAPVVQLDSLKLHRHRPVGLHLPDVQLSLRQRFDEVRDAIDAFAPDVVIVLGFMSPLAYSLHADYPVIGLPTHALPPVAPVDVWLSAHPQAEPVAWPGVPAPQVFPFPFRFWPADPFVAVNREALGLPADAVVLMTVGYRLDTEIASPWREHMLAFIDAQPSVHWVLIGVAEGQALAGLSTHSRIRVLPPKNLLPAWLAMADIYVNPPRIGGGGSVAMAMEQGLPVASFVGGDGGDKLGELAVDSRDAYFSQLDAWVRYPEVRKQVGEALKASFHARLDMSGEQATAGLMQACYLAAESFNRRMEAAGA